MSHTFITDPVLVSYIDPGYILGTNNTINNRNPFFYRLFTYVALSQNVKNPKNMSLVNVPSISCDNLDSRF